MASDEAEEPANSLEEVKICDICGDAGFDDCLAICNRCNEGAEHVYCMVTILDAVPLDWVCEACKAKEKKNNGKKRFACDRLLSTQAHKKQNVSREHRISVLADKAALSGLSCWLLPAGGESVKDAGTIQVASGSTSKADMKKLRSQDSPSFGPKTNSVSKGVSAENATVEHLIVKQKSETEATFLGALRGASGVAELGGSESAKDTSSPRTDKIVTRSRPRADMGKFVRGDLPSVSLKTITQEIGPNLNSPSKGESAGEVAAPSEGVKGPSGLLGTVGGVFVEDTSSTGIIKPVFGRGLQAYDEMFASKDSTILPNSPCEGKPANEAGRHIVKQGSEAVGAAAPSSHLMRGPSGQLVFVHGESMKDALSAGTDKLASGSRTAPIHTDSALKRTVDNADKDASNHISFSADKLTSGSQRVLSKSVSMKTGYSQGSFLLPSRPKNLTRSNSAIAQSNDSTVKLPNQQENLATVTGKERDDHRFHARCEASDRIDSSKPTLTVSRPRTQARKDDDDHHFHARRELDMIDSTKPILAESRPCTQAGLDAGFRNVKYGQSSRDPETSRYWGRSSGPRTGCYKCKEVGHIPETCKGVSSGRQMEWRTNEVPASGEKGLLGKRPDPIQVNNPFWGFQGLLDERRPWRHKLQPKKERKFVRNNLRSESHAIDCVKMCLKRSPKASEHTGIYETYRHEVQPRKEPKFERNSSRSERPHNVDFVKMGSKQKSPKPSEYAIVHEKQIVRVQVLDRQKADFAASSPPAHPSPVTSSPKIGKHSPHQHNSTSQQAGPVEALRGGYSQEDECCNATSISTSRADLAFGSRRPADGSQCPGGDNFFLEMRAIPDLQIVWSGCFNVSLSTSCSTSYKGMQAHPSNRADPKVFEATMALPVELHLQELKRGLETDSWPRSFQEHPPTSNSIGIYFFPVDMESHDTWYKPLLDRLTAHDLALRIKLEFAQLLIFPSQLLPEAEQCWDDRQYLWGVFRTNKGKETVKDSSPGAPLPPDGDLGNHSGSPKAQSLNKNEKC